MFNNVIGQQRVKKILTNIHKSERLSHAYIFHGKEGIGKDAMAIEFSRLINNESPETNIFHTEYFNFITSLPAGTGDAGENSDPLLGLDKKDFDVYRSEMENKSEDFYHKINIPKANNIRIDSIRFIKRKIYLTGRENKKKIYVISDADKMSQESANALLKILEEPPKNSLLILTTSRINSLLPTIIGRCQLIKFDDISLDDLTNYINKTFNEISSEEAALYASLSDGSISACNALIENDTLEFRESMLNLLAAALSGRSLLLGDEIDYIISMKSKSALKQYLSIMLLWFSDLVLRDSGSVDFIANKDKIDRLDKFNSKFEFDYYDVILSIEDAIREIDMNVNQELILFNLIYKLKAIINPLKTG